MPPTINLEAIDLALIHRVLKEFEQKVGVNLGLLTFKVKTTDGSRHIEKKGLDIVSVLRGTRLHSSSVCVLCMNCGSTIDPITGRTVIQYDDSDYNDGTSTLGGSLLTQVDNFRYSERYNYLPADSEIRCGSCSKKLSFAAEIINLQDTGIFLKCSDPMFPYGEREDIVLYPQNFYHLSFSLTREYPNDENREYTILTDLAGKESIDGRNQACMRVMIGVFTLDGIGLNLIDHTLRRCLIDLHNTGCPSPVVFESMVKVLLDAVDFAEFLEKEHLVNASSTANCPYITWYFDNLNHGLHSPASYIRGLASLLLLSQYLDTSVPLFRRLITETIVDTSKLDNTQLSDLRLVARTLRKIVGSISDIVVFKCSCLSAATSHITSSSNVIGSLSWEGPGENSEYDWEFKSRGVLLVRWRSYRKEDRSLFRCCNTTVDGKQLNFTKLVHEVKDYTTLEKIPKGGPYVSVSKDSSLLKLRNPPGWEEVESSVKSRHILFARRIRLENDLNSNSFNWSELKEKRQTALNRSFVKQQSRLENILKELQDESTNK
jgi:hypothetical protein